MNSARGRDDYDVYDVPDSPTKRLKTNNGTWRPWVVSQGTSDPGNTIHVSTPDRHMETNDRRESHQPAKQQATPRRKSNLRLVCEALRTEPENGLSFDNIIDWLRTNRSAVYQERGEEKLRRAINATLKQQAQKTPPTIWQWENKNWQLGEALLAKTSLKEGTEKDTEGHTRIPSAMVPSSTERRTSDGTSESFEATPRSELQQTRERHYANSQNSPPAFVSQVQAKSTLAAIESQPSHPSPEADARPENEHLASNGAAPTAPTAVGDSFDHDETLIQTEPAAGSISMTPNNEHSNTVESRAPANPCDDPNQDGKNEPDLGEVVRELRQIKRERKIQEQKIGASRSSLPDVSALTQSVNEAQRAADEAQCVADEAQRVADEAHRVTETAKKAAEDAQAKQKQFAADEIYLEKLVQDSHILRAQLDID